MDEEDRAQGWTLLESLTDLQPPENIHFFILLAGTRVKGAVDPNELARRRAAAWEPIALRLGARELFAAGFAPGEKTPELIHHGFCADALPDWDTDTLALNGTTYAGVRIYRKPPETLPPLAETRETEPPQKKGKGGRPAWSGETAFVREIIRVANTPDGITSRRELTKHMKDWCDAHWTNPISDETIRLKVIKFLPDGIPPE